jgi:hypothetical protein
MKYLKLYEDKVNTNFNQEILKLKELPYSDFVNNLKKMTVDPSSKDKLQTSFKPTDSIENYGNSREKNITAKSLIPTQVNIGLKESLSWMSEKKSIGEIILDGKASIYDKNRILVLNNKWIIEGHQKWAYVYMLNPDCQIPCINISMPDQGVSMALKDIQIGLAATYGDLYFEESEIKYDISLMEPKDIEEAVKKIIPDSYVLLLQEAFAKTSFKRQIVKAIVPKSITESKKIQSSDFLELLDEKKPDDEKIEQLDSDKDEEGEKEQKEPGAEKKIQKWLGAAGWVDPTGVADILNGAIYIYSGNYLMGFLSIMSALPMADIACKGLMKILEGVAAKQLTKLLGKALRKFDAKAAAKIWLKLEKKFPAVGPWLKTIVDGISLISQKIGKVAEIISKHWLKFRVVQILFQTKIVNFFKELFNFKLSLKEWMDKVPEEEVYKKISDNAIAIKDLMIDRKISQLKIPKGLAPHILQTALKVGQDPKSRSFKGIPTNFLTSLPNVAGSLKKAQESKPKLKSFDDFDKKPKKLEPELELEEKPKVKETPKEIKPKVLPKKEQPKTKEVPKPKPTKELAK